MKRRITSFVLALIMVLLVAFPSSFAVADTAQTDPLPTVEKVDELSNMEIRVGIHFKSGSDSYLRVFNTLSSSNGLTFYNGSREKPFTLLTTQNKVSLVQDTCIYKSGVFYYKTADISQGTYFGYNYVTEATYSTLDAANEKVAQFKELFNNKNIFPFYLNGAIHVGIGMYKTESVAKANLATVVNATGMPLSIHAPSDKVISVIDETTSAIVLKADTSGSKLYVDAVDSSSQNYYIKKLNSAGNNTYNYDGTFEYGVSADGISLVNILKFDSYIKCVIPYEISSSWNYETMKAFAITVRSYTLYKMKGHSSLGFHVCDMTHCQAYLGVDRTTENVVRAVDETKDIIVTYNDELARTYYHAISGGATETCTNVWGGGDQPYLVAQKTPLENYSKYTNGAWEKSVKLSELSEKLMNTSRFSSVLTGEITDISITKYTAMGYAYTMQVTDDKQKAVTFSTSDLIRTILSSYCKSGKFTIKKETQADNDVLYTFTGSGWGHGVGLSQYGAKDMGEAGYTFDEILALYFPGTDLSRVSVNTSTLAITVTEKLSFSKEPALTLSSAPSKLVYALGEGLDITGGVLTYTDGKGRSSSYAVTSSMISGFDSSKAGKVTLTVSYLGLSVTYDITVLSDAPAVLTSTTCSVDETLKTVSKVSSSLKAADFVKLFTESAYVKVQKASGEPLGSAENVGTGMKVTLGQGDEIKSSYTIIVTGDINGDGTITLTDFVQLKSQLLGKTALKGAFLSAADINADKYVTLTDFVQLKSHILGKTQITPKAY